MKKLLILDRDGVINIDSPNYIKSVDEWHCIDGSVQAIADLYHFGYTVVVATNQQGISKGLYSINSLNQIHNVLKSQLAEYGAHISAIFFCPHLASDNCDCRKPKPGMFVEAIERFDAKAADTFVVGDALRDLQAAHACGAKPILVRTGKGVTTEQQLQSNVDATLTDTPVFNDLSSFVKQLLGEH